MALTKEQLHAMPGGERRFETEALPNGELLRGRTLLRGERRRFREFLRKFATDKKGNVSDDKYLYYDDILAAFHLCDDSGATILTPEEAVNGFFDEWDDASAAALTKLLRKLQPLPEGEDIEGAIKNSDETPGSDISGVSADGTE